LDTDTAGPLCLVLMPGDARLVEDAGATPLARVLQVSRSALGMTATVEVCGQTVVVPCEASLRPGAEVSLALVGSPRLLPKGLPEEPPEEP
jgi:hypothetical protein